MKSCTSTARDCPVCLQTAVFPVQTNCGHLFCGTTYNLTFFVSVEQCQSRRVLVKLPPTVLMWFSVPWAELQGLHFRVDMRLNLEFDEFTSDPCPKMWIWWQRLLLPNVKKWYKLALLPQSSYQWIKILNICFEVDDLQGLVTDYFSMTLLSVNWLISHLQKSCTPSCLQGFNCFFAPWRLITFVFLWYISRTNSWVQIVWYFRNIFRKSNYSSQISSKTNVTK